MDKGNSPNEVVRSPPPPGAISMFASPESSYQVKSESSGSSSLPPLGPVASGGVDSTQFNNDIIQMPDNPTWNLGHRRAQSEFTLPDDTGFDTNLSVVGGTDEPSLSDEIENEDFLSMCLDLDQLDSSSLMNEASALPPGQEVTPTMSPRIRHQHSQSLDGSTMVKSEVPTSGGEEPSAVEKRKFISDAKFAVLSAVDPQRAKRIWANRQSAARSKEKKMKHMAELEKKLQALQAEESIFSAQLADTKGDTSGLNTENNELKLRLQSVEQQVSLQEALNTSLKDEIRHLKTLASYIANSGSLLNYSPSFSGNPQFYSNNHAYGVRSMSAAQQFHQLQINSPMPQQQHPFQQYHQLQQPQAQPMMQQREQLHQSGDMILRGNVPASYAPAPYAPTSYAPAPYAPTSYAPAPYAPTSYAPAPYAHTSYAPAPYAPTSYAPAQYAPTSYAPAPYAPTSYAPAPYAPTSYAPAPYAPTSYAPTSDAPASYAPASYAQHDNASDDAPTSYAPASYAQHDNASDVAAIGTGTEQHPVILN